MKVLVLDGDGGLLMNLGSLVTIAGQQPRNLVHFVFEDGVYNTTGGQPVPGAGTFDLAEMARSAGFAESYQFDNLEDLVSELPGIIEQSGPVFVSLKVAHIQPPPRHAPPPAPATPCAASWTRWRSARYTRRSCCPPLRASG